VRLTARQISAAMALAGMNQDELASAAGIARPTLNKILRDGVVAKEATLSSIRHTLEARNIEFTANQGVRLRPGGLEVYEGPERFEAFYDFLYEQLKAHGGDVCLSVTDERLLAKYRKDHTVHYERMQDLHDRGVIKSFRILANQSNFSSKYPYNLYKWQPKASLAPTAFYTFGDCLALISFVHDTPPYVVVLQSAPLANSYRQAFDAAWAAAEEPPRPKEGT
jgi:transcriptional regulator with XRE-family HTH domain